MNLTFAQEDALAEWVKEMGWRGVPLHASAVAQHALPISGKKIGEHWVQCYHIRHPELKVKWTSGLEKCQAQALNPTAVKNFYETLDCLIKEYNIPEENIYNMDEKGVQLRVGGRTLALVDQDQKTVKQVEGGNWELVTVIECVAADRSAI